MTTEKSEKEAPKFTKKTVDKRRVWLYNKQALSARPRQGRSGMRERRRGQRNMEWYRSGHNEHDWKSCDGQKPSEGSNPSHSAKTEDRLQEPVLCFGIGIVWEGFEPGGKTVRWTVFPTAGGSLPPRENPSRSAIKERSIKEYLFPAVTKEHFLLSHADGYGIIVSTNRDLRGESL